MGGRRLPQAQILIAAAVAFLVMATGCHSGGATATPSPEPPTAGSTVTPTTPIATATPDVLATPPASQLDARAWLQAALGPSKFEPPCPESIRQRGVACASGDVDADGLAEVAYLVPVRVSGAVPYPAAVFLRRGNSQKLEEFSLDLTADHSPVGVSVFGLEDRTGDGNDDLTFIENRCGATGCMTTVLVMIWDGTAWRDIGPGAGGTSNVDSLRWEKSGKEIEFVVHGGKLPLSAPPEAGPTRASTKTYRFTGGRFALATVEPDPPEYLYHAFLDAEAVFERDKEASIEAFEEVIGMTDLKDWKSRPNQADRRPSLVGFALFRIALAKASLQRDPAEVSAALDRVILQSQEPAFEQLFVNVASEFRNGYLGPDPLISACNAVNLYLAKPLAGTDTRAYVEQLFNYGYANPPGTSWLTDICPF